MARQRNVFQLLRQSKGSIVDRAMAAAFPTADSTTTRLIALSILERCHPEGTIGLVQHCHRLPPDVQKTIMAQVVPLDHTLRKSASGDNPFAAINVIEILWQARAPHLAYLVSEQLRRGTENTRTLAAQGLLELALFDRGRHLRTPATSWSSTDLQFVYTVVDDAVAQFASHKQRQILSAMAVLASRPLPKARAALAEHRHPAVEPM